MIDWALYAAFVGFTFSSAFTPGPNNFMLMSSGALFGFRKTVPHILGIALGFNNVLLSALFGMDVVIAQLPWLLTAVKIAGATWLAWLGLKFFKTALAHKDNHKTLGNKAETKNRSRHLNFTKPCYFNGLTRKV